MKELFMWLTAICGILLCIAITAAAAGFAFGVFIKFAKLAFYFVGV